VTVNFNQCKFLLALTPEQFERVLDAARDRAAIVTTGESLPPDPPSSVFPAAAPVASESDAETPCTVIPFRRVAA
jgi:uncharacterized protein